MIMNVRMRDRMLVSTPVMRMRKGVLMGMFMIPDQGICHDGSGTGNHYKERNQISP